MLLRSLRTACAALAFISLGILPLTPASATSLAPMSLEETVRDAAAIFVGRAVRTESRWGSPARRWITTEVTFAVEDAILPAAGVRTGHRVTLPFWGGTVDGQTQEIAGAPLPTVGDRSVMLLRPDWGRPGFTPAVGVTAGMWRVGATGQVEIPPSHPASGMHARSLKGARSHYPAPSSLRDLTRWLRANVRRIKLLNRAPSTEHRAPLDDPRVLRTFALTPEFDATPAATGLFQSPGAGRVPSPEVVAPRSPDEYSLATAVPPPPEHPIWYPVNAIATSLPRTPHPAPRTTFPDTVARVRYYPFGRCNLPIVVNALPPSYAFRDTSAPWTPEDQYQIAKWNHYANIFQVRADPTGTYGWGNGSFDLAGWVPPDALLATYGATWGQNQIAITFRRKNASGIIEEADIALNPAFNWTLNDEWVYDGAPAISFRHTLVHELGHMLGLDDQKKFVSVMNQPQNAFRGFCFPSTDDAEGIRAIYPGQLQARTDLAIYMFRATGVENYGDPTFPNRVAPGDQITVGDYHVENVGTERIVRPAIEWYLGTARSFDAPNVYLGSTLYPPLKRFDYFYTHTVARRLTVPSTTPPGDYYLGAFIPGEPGIGQPSFPFINNIAWTRSKLTVVAP